ncbi:MAG: SDR family oxidoreductase [Cyanobacteria bacterium]|nr:SDR family oxidoreductase [Cyanobacteriota bacterium]
MKLKDKTILVTGANRGIGKALVEAVLKFGAKKIYATARKVDILPNFNDSRVIPMKLDITDRAQTKKAAEEAQDVELLINNAGALAFASVLEGPLEMLIRDMEVNYFGTLNVSRAFAPVIADKVEGGIATISSIVGLASMSGIGGYSASKSALFSAIQSMRAELKPKKIEVYGIFPGPIDTDMSRTMTIDKTSPEVTAENILRAIESGQEDIFPDPMSAELSQLWASNPRALETKFASM